MRQIRMLRAMWRELETGLRRLPNGHEGGNPGNGQGAVYGLPRQFPTLPGNAARGACTWGDAGPTVHGNARGEEQSYRCGSAATTTGSVRSV